MSVRAPSEIYPVLIFHVDVNSAFLSWSALKELQKNPEGVDLRTIPSAVAGDIETRHGIITAKSIPAKKYGIETAEPVASALRKCPNLVLVKSDFETYRKYSKALMAILKTYSDEVQQVSIDEAYLDMTWRWSDPDPLLPVRIAGEIREEVKKKLGFTVNVGISVNKLLAKTASDFAKPDQTHTLWPEEIPEKLWPMPIGALHGCGHATAGRLEGIGIRTVGDAARTDPAVLKSLLGEKTGTYILESANGLGSVHVSSERDEAKSYSNEITTASDIRAEDFENEAIPMIRRLSRKVSERLKRDQVYGKSVTVSVKTDHFKRRSRQVTLTDSSNDASVIEANAVMLARELLFGESGPFTRGEGIRLIGVGVSHLDRGEYRQLSLFDYFGPELSAEQERPQTSQQAAAPQPQQSRERAAAPQPQQPGERAAAPQPQQAEELAADQMPDEQESKDPRREKLDAMMARIRAKYGERSIRRGQ